MAFLPTLATLRLLGVSLVFDSGPPGIKGPHLKKAVPCFGVGGALAKYESAPPTPGIRLL
jgi:hypothetical protein